MSRSRISALLAAVSAALLALVVPGLGSDEVVSGGGGGTRRLSISADLWGNGVEPTIHVFGDWPHTCKLAIDALLYNADGADIPRAVAGGDSTLDATRKHNLIATPDSMPASTGDTLGVYVRLVGSMGQTVLAESESIILQAPSAPAGLVATAGVNSISLAWSPVDSATGYNLYRDGSLITYAPTDTFNAAVTSNINSLTQKDATLFVDPSDGAFHVLVIDAETAWNASADTLQCGEKWFRHYKSSDLLSWVEVDSLDAGNLSVPGYNIVHVWAPHLIVSDGKYRLFYTGVDRITYPADPLKRIERIFYAEADTSADLDDPTIWTGRKFLIDGDEDGADPGLPGVSHPCAWVPGTANRTECRDPWVVYDSDISKWVMTASVRDSAGTKLAVGIATADTVSGPYTLHGWHRQTANAAKAESSSLVWDGTDWILFWVNGDYSAYSHGVSSRGPFPFNSSGFDYLLAPTAIEPLVTPITRPNGDRWDALANRQSVDESWISSALGGGIRGVSSYTSNHKEIDSPLRVEVSSPVTIEMTAFVDRGITAGVEHVYTVEAILANGGTSDVSLPDTATAYNEVTLASAATAYSSLTTVFTVNATVTEPDIPWQYRYRYVIGPEVACADVDTATWSAATDVPAYTSSITWQLPDGEDPWDYCYSQVEVQAVETAVGWGDSTCSYAQRIVPPISAGSATATPDTTGVDHMDIAWGPEAEAHALWDDPGTPHWYQIVRTIKAGVAVNDTLCVQEQTRACIDDDMAGAGAYVYVITTVMTINGTTMYSTSPPSAVGIKP